MLNIAVIVSGGGTNLQTLIDAIRENKVTGGRIALVIADRDGIYAITRADENNIPVHVVKRREMAKADFESEVLRLFEKYDIDIAVTAGFLGVLSEEFVRRYPNKIINIHPSLIPKHCGKGFYGLRVHQSVLDAGDKVTGATVHYVDEGIDSGEIIIKKEIPVMPGDTAETLQKRVMNEAERNILPIALQKLIDRFNAAAR